jgi:hypothetical protein
LLLKIRIPPILFHPIRRGSLAEFLEEVKVMELNALRVEIIAHASFRGLGTNGKAPYPMPVGTLMLPQNGTDVGIGVRCIAEIHRGVETITRRPLDGHPHSRIYSY